MKRIALFGATGRTGSEFLELALSNNYSIQALARNPASLQVKNANLQVIQGDVMDLASVKKVVAECDIVVSLFGQVKGSPKDLQTRGTENILTSMHAYGVSKIISLSGGGLPFPEKDEPKFPDKMIRFIMKIAVPHILEDAIEHGKLLENSKMKWVIVRAPRLTMDPKKGEYRVGWVGVNASTKISRKDLVDFILLQVESDDYLYQMPFVSY